MYMTMNVVFVRVFVLKLLTGNMVPIGVLIVMVLLAWCPLNCCFSVAEYECGNHNSIDVIVADQEIGIRKSADFNISASEGSVCKTVSVS